MLARDSPYPNGKPAAEEETAVEAAAAAAKEEEADAARLGAREEGERTRDPQEHGEHLSTDPEVARLLAELQDELDSGCCSDGSSSREGGERGVGEEDDEEEKEKEDEEENENENDTENEKEKEKDGGARNIQAVAEKETAERENKRPPLSPLREKKATQSGRAPSTGSTLPPQAERGHQEDRGGIDISRMKIDGPPHHTHWRRGMARPQSAPSACLSAGGFSKLSRASSSSRIARTVSQKLLQATKEAEEQRAAGISEARGGGCRNSVASAIAQADGRIDVVKQNAEALQVRKVCLCHLVFLGARRCRGQRRKRW